MAVTNLTNTQWLFNEDLDINTLCVSRNVYHINFNSNSETFLSLYGQPTEETRTLVYAQTSTNTDVYTLPVSTPETASWTSPNYRSIYILGGEDVENAQLLVWLQNNAQQIVDLTDTAWMLRDTITSPPPTADFETVVNFTSNNLNCHNIKITSVSSTPWYIDYGSWHEGITPSGTDWVRRVYDINNTPKWADDAFRKIHITNGSPSRSVVRELPSSISSTVPGLGSASIFLTGLRITVTDRSSPARSYTTGTVTYDTPYQITDTTTIDIPTTTTGYLINLNIKPTNHGSTLAINCRLAKTDGSLVLTGSVQAGSTITIQNNGTDLAFATWLQVNASPMVRLSKMTVGPHKIASMYWGDKSIVQMSLGDVDIWNTSIIPTPPAPTYYNVTLTSSGPWYSSQDGIIEVWDNDSPEGNKILELDPADKTAFPITVTCFSGSLYIRASGPFIYDAALTSAEYLSGSVWPDTAITINQNGSIDIYVDDFDD